MIWRGLWLVLRVTWSGWRALALAVGTGLLWVFCRFTNPWDLLLFSVLDHEIVIIIVPMYLLILNRDLRHPWEALVATHLGQARTWWAVHVGLAGVTAVMVSVSVVVLVVVVPLAAGGWTWHWGPFAVSEESASLLHTPAWRLPWLWSLESLGLLTLSLWALGVLEHVLALWWRGPWPAFVSLVLLSFCSLGVEGTALQGLVWWLPGSQFSLAAHGASTAFVPAGWSVVYAVALLATAAGVGLVMVRSSPWDTTSGGST